MDENLKKIELSANFKGNVQGVFFRYFAKKFADELKIQGYAKNLTDGSVEILAIGEKTILEKFLKKIRKKPGYGKIEKENLSFSSAKKKFFEFKIY